MRIFRKLAQLLDVDVSGAADNDSLTYDAASGKWVPEAVSGGGGGGGAPTDADYLVGTASASLSAEIVVGTSPGGELGGTWAAPTVDATHSGSSHAAVQAAAEATAAAALSAHSADTTAVHGIADTSALETSAGAQAKVDAHVNDTSAAHAASAISYNGSTNLSSTDVEAALDELDGEKQPLDSDLTAIAALVPSNDDIVQRKAGAWTNRTVAQLLADLAAPGTTFQPLDGDLTALADSNLLPVGVAVQETQDTATLGSNLVANGNFATGDLTGWTAGAGWAYSAGGVQHTAGSAAALSQTLAGIVNGGVYQIDVSQTGATAGTITWAIGAAMSDARPFWGVLGATLVAVASGSLSFSVTPSSDYNGTLDNIQVRQITANIPAAGSVKNASGTALIEFRAVSTTSVAIGLNALRRNTTGVDNTAVGYSALSANTTGNSLVAVGVGALAANTSGIRSVAVGHSALGANTTGGNNVAVGWRSLVTNTTGTDNTAVGYSSLTANTTGAANVAVGSQALGANTTGAANVAVGSQALGANTTGASNVAVGSQALGANTTGASNTAVGSQAGYSPAGTAANATVAGQRNTLLGYQTGASSSGDPSDMVAVGYRALATTDSVALGSGAQATGTGSVALGKAVTTSVANQIALGTSSHHILLKTAAAPADASLAASQFTLWLDPTNGAAKLMVKAKQADGTVKTAAIALA